MPFNAVDIVIFVPLVAMAIKGLKNGLIHEVLSLFGQIIAIFLSFTYMNEVGQILVGYLGMSNAWVPLLAFIAIYILVIILVNLIIKVLNAMVKLAFLSVYNLILGAIFSALKATLLFSVIFILLLGFDIPDKETRENSLLYEYVLPIAPGAYNAVAVIYPGVTNFEGDVTEYMDKFNPFNNYKSE